MTDHAKHLQVQVSLNSNANLSLLHTLKIFIPWSLRNKKEVETYFNDQMFPTDSHKRNEENKVGNTA
ncbi:CLUMA_CG018437, isoform A [Clunio marinus]|uniref:CLUMA_CG018437, isoform A n=1 Tax=Clunio marinus TaxID=568069 RepID=A0A1J1J185_9DIPT|nr:CLUMA_CG018437, isoform A [Clunio marinus]